MFDFIKARKHGNVDFLLGNPLLNLQTTISTDTGLINGYPYKMPKPYKHIKIDVNSDHYYLKGTFHKYWQEGRNWQDFTISDFKKAMQEFELELDLNIKDSKLHFVEYGVNIIPPFKPTLSNIRQIFISYRGKPFQPLRSFTSDQIGVECVFSQYRIKIYSKMLQYKLDTWVLRFEIQVMKMQKIKYKNLIVEDLYTNKGLLEYLKNDLVEVMQNFIIFDNKIKGKTPNQGLFLSNVGNPNFWANLNTKTLFKQKQRYKKMVQDNGSTLHADLIDLVKKKGDILTV